MFDVGFSELCLVGLVSLIVIGPEKLPQVARMLGFWLGKARHMAASVKQEFNAEMHAEEVRQLAQEQSALLKEISGESMRLQHKLMEDIAPLQADLSKSTPAVHAEGRQSQVHTAKPTPSVSSHPTTKRLNNKKHRHGKK